MLCCGAGDQELQVGLQDTQAPSSAMLCTRNHALLWVPVIQVLLVGVQDTQAPQLCNAVQKD